MPRTITSKIQSASSIATNHHIRPHTLATSQQHSNLLTPPDSSLPLVVVTPDPFSDALLELQAGKPCSERDFEAIQRALRPIAQRALEQYTPHLQPAREHVDDALGHLWILVVEYGHTGSRFDPTRASALHYLRLLLRRAAWRVSKDVGAPPTCVVRRGSRNRRVKDRIVRHHSQSLDAARGLNADGDSIPSLGETLAASGFGTIEAALDKWHAAEVIESVRRETSDVVAGVLDVMYREDLLLQEASARMGVSRFVVRRQLRRFVQCHLAEIAA